MAVKTALCFAFGLVVVIAVTAKPQLDGGSLGNGSSSPMETRNSFNSEVPVNPRFQVSEVTPVKEVQKVDETLETFPPLSQEKLNNSKVSFPESSRLPILESGKVFSTEQQQKNFSLSILTLPNLEKINTLTPNQPNTSAPESVKGLSSKQSHHNVSGDSILLLPLDKKSIPVYELPKRIGPPVPNTDKNLYSNPLRINYSLGTDSAIPLKKNTTSIIIGPPSPKSESLDTGKEISTGKMIDIDSLDFSSFLPLEINNNSTSKFPFKSNDLNPKLLEEPVKELPVKQLNAILQRILSSLPLETSHNHTIKSNLKRRSLSHEDYDEDLSGKQLSNNSTLDIVSSPPQKINRTFIFKFLPQNTRPWSPEAEREMVIQCVRLCRVCNLTSTPVNGTCKCIDTNGKEVVCAGKASEEDKTDITGALELEDNGRNPEMRGERCLLTTAPLPQGILQSKLGQGLKGMSTEERLAEFKKRVEALRMKPAVKEKKSEHCGKDISPPGKGSSPILPLPVSPFRSSNYGEKFDKEKKSEHCGKEISPPGKASSLILPLPVSPFRNRNYGEKFDKDYKGLVKVEDIKIKSFSKGIKAHVPFNDCITNKAKPLTLSCRVVPVSPVRRSIDSSPSSSGLKLPEQFLAETRLREQVTDVTKSPDDVGNTETTREQILLFLKPKHSAPPVTIKVEPLSSPKSPDSSYPTIPFQDNRSGSDIMPQNELVKLLDIANYKGNKAKSFTDLNPEGDDIAHQDEIPEPILEGIIAIPKYMQDEVNNSGMA